MNPDTMLETVKGALTSRWADTAVGLVLPSLRGGDELVRDLVRFGARPVFAIAHEVHAEVDALVQSTLVLPKSMESSSFSLTRCSGRAPAGVERWLDEVDKERRALLIGSPFAESSRFQGRVVYGYRRPRWAAWEDKSTIDQRLQQLGIAAPQSVHLSSDSAPGTVGRAYEAMDDGNGVVVSAGAGTQLDQGASTHVWWVRRASDLAPTWTLAAERGGTIRLARFVPGVPCSVFGFVLPDGVAVLDPIELLVLARDEGGQFDFCGSSTRWRPDPVGQAAIRRVARIIGRAMAREDDYRGLFAVDGIMSPAGFVVTEVNARHASGLGLREAWEGFPIYLFNRAIMEGEDNLRAVRAMEIESVFRAAIGANPSDSIRFPRAYADPRRGGAREAGPVAKGSQTVGGSGARPHTLEPWTTEGFEVLPEGPQKLLGPAVASLARQTYGGGVHGFDTWTLDRA